MGTLIIMRGVPGSGKSYEAKRLSGDCPAKVFSTDEWFALQPGGYLANWAVDKLFKAHRWNQDRVRAALSAGVTPIVVDNTNIKMRDARTYFDMAVEAGYEVLIEESTSPWWVEIKTLLGNKKANEAAIRKWAEKLAHGFVVDDKTIKNEHGVPADVIHNMLMNYQPYTVKDLFSTSS